MWILLFAGFIQFWGFKDLHRPWRYLENFQRFVRDEISTSTNIIRHQSFVYNCRLIHFNFQMQYNVVIHRVITGKKFSPSIYLEVSIYIHILCAFHSKRSLKSIQMEGATETDELWKQQLVFIVMMHAVPKWTKNWLLI